MDFPRASTHLNLALYLTCTIINHIIRNSRCLHTLHAVNSCHGRVALITTVILVKALGLMEMTLGRLNSRDTVCFIGPAHIICRLRIRFYEMVRCPFVHLSVCPSMGPQQQTYGMFCYYRRHLLSSHRGITCRLC